METKLQAQEIYEPQFEQLKPSETMETLNAVPAISEGMMELEALIGFTHEKIEKIVNFKVGDVLRLEKNLEEPLDIVVNGVDIASGESMIIHDRIAVRLSKIKSMQEEE